MSFQITFCLFRRRKEKCDILSKLRATNEQPIIVEPTIPVPPIIEMRKTPEREEKIDGEGEQFRMLDLRRRGPSDTNQVSNEWSKKT